MSRRELDHLVRFVHPERLCRALPGSSKLSPAEVAVLYGVSEEELVEAQNRLASDRAEALATLLQQEAYRRFVERPRLRPGDVVLAVGDSLTDDRLSWCEVLADALSATPPLAGVRVVNAGVSGHTTADAIGTFLHAAASKPNWIVFLLGTNDARRHGWPRERPLLAPEQTLANLRTLHEMARERTTAQVVWITPPPIRAGRQHDHWLLRGEEIWYHDDDLRTIASAVRSLPGRVVDLWPAFERHDLDELYLDDGIHLTSKGQVVVACAVARALTDG